MIVALILSVAKNWSTSRDEGEKPSQTPGSPTTANAEISSHPSPTSNMETIHHPISLCCDRRDLRAAHDELVHKWQFVHRNLSDREEFQKNFLERVGKQYDSEFCGTKLIRSRLDSLEKANKLGHEGAGLLLATMNYALCSMCVRERLHDQALDALEADTGADGNQQFEVVDEGAEGSCFGTVGAVCRAIVANIWKVF